MEISKSILDLANGNIKDYSSHRKIFDSCKQLKMELPDETKKYFNGDEPIDDIVESAILEKYKSKKEYANVLGVTEGNLSATLFRMYRNYANVKNFLSVLDISLTIKKQ